MKITENIRLEALSIYFPKEQTLILSDLHIGYEEALNKQGVMVPRIYFPKLYKKTKKLLMKFDVKKIIINGDLKHEFGTISKTEWRHTLRFLDLFKDKEVFLIKGNHDKILGPIAKKKNVQIVEKYLLSDTMIVHGDNLIDIPKGIKNIIIGHEHPAITIQASTRSETYKCFLIGKYKRKNLIAMPSYNELTEGTNILNERILSPFLKRNLDNFRIIIYGDDLYDFGKLKDIKKLNKK